VLPRLERALRRLNPWLPEDGLRRAMRAVTHVEAATLLEANEKVWVALTYGVSVEVTEDGRRTSRTVRYFDFEDSAINDFLVVRQFQSPARRRRSFRTLLHSSTASRWPWNARRPRWVRLQEATDRLERYQELAARYQLGAAALPLAQVLIAACGEMPATHGGNAGTRLFTLEECLSAAPSAWQSGWAGH
jgi:hypothetical protein